jgi:hypothetical protein
MGHTAVGRGRSGRHASAPPAQDSSFCCHLQNGCASRRALQNQPRKSIKRATFAAPRIGTIDHRVPPPCYSLAQHIIHARAQAVVL